MRNEANDPRKTRPLGDVAVTGAAADPAAAVGDDDDDDNG